MKCTIHVYLLNALYSQELADRDHGGRETADNRKFLWEDEFVVKGTVTGINEVKNAIYPLQGVLEDGSAFHHDVKGMTLMAVETSENPVLYVGASSSILARTEIRKGKDFVVNIFLKDDEPYANPIPGIYVASREFPQQLIR
ncbi:MAG: hypothetical protein ACK45H_11275 [Bacteroidota bacterium]|jgi:hypothetical protein